MTQSAIRTNIQTWVLACLVSMAMPGCKCSHSADGATGESKDSSSVTTTHTDLITDYDPPETIPGGNQVLSQQMEKNLVANFQKFIYAQNDKDWDTYIDGYYKPMVDIYNRDTLMKQFQLTADKMGWQNIVISHEIEKITPVVEMDSLFLVGLRARVNLDIVIGKEYEGDPETWKGAIKSKYPTAEYDAPNRTFHVNEKMKFYCITSKSNLNFQFLVDSYFNDPKLASLIRQDVFIKLRSYE